MNYTASAGYAFGSVPTNEISTTITVDDDNDLPGLDDSQSFTFGGGTTWTYDHAYSCADIASGGGNPYTGAIDNTVTIRGLPGSRRRQRCHQLLQAAGEQERRAQLHDLLHLGDHQGG